MTTTSVETLRARIAELRRLPADRLDQVLVRSDSLLLPISEPRSMGVATDLAVKRPVPHLGG